MTPAARFKTITTLLDGLLTHKTPADHALNFFFKNNRYVGGGDRRFIKDTIYGMLRGFYRLETLLSQANAPHDALHSVFLYFMIMGTITPENVDDFTSDSPHTFQTLPRTLENLMNTFTKLDLDILDDENLECPKWLKDKLGDVPFESMLHNPGPTVRANTLKTTRDALLQSFKFADIKASPTKLSPHGIAIERAPLLEQTPLFKEGLFEIQDEGSQLLALLCNPGEHDKVLDYCAGACGKTLAIAALMKNRGRILATDIDEKRLERGVRRLKRAGVSNTQSRPLNAETNGYLKKHKQFFDLVLLDAPCSGTGTWRRNPEARIYLNKERLQEYIALQREILEKAWPLVKPGGRLVYATCSFLPQENEEQIAWFLSQNLGFETVSLESITALPQDLRDPTPYFKLNPHTHGTDGFFGCVLVRRK